MKLFDVLFENVDNKLKPLYGNNFQYELKKYIAIEDGLAGYGVHFSVNNNIAIYPQTKYYPKGVYFYFLDNGCDAGFGHGFATDRPWANVVKINNDRMLILKQGHSRNFTEKDLETAIQKLRLVTKTDNLSSPSQKPGKQDVPAVALFNLLHTLETGGKGSTNKLLHLIGYDGVVDYDGALLPIESCQGVMTWVGGVTLVQSIPTNPKSSTDPEQRLSKILRGLQHKPNGSLKLSWDEIEQAKGMLPKFWHRWDKSDAQSSFYAMLFRKLDFGYADSWNWARFYDDIRDQFIEDLEQNPTTPLGYWEQFLGANDPVYRAIAREKLYANKHETV